MKLAGISQDQGIIANQIDLEQFKIKPRSIGVEQKLNYAHPYLFNRGIDLITAREFGIGEYENKILCPVHDLYGNFVRYVPRMLDNTEPKYDFTGLAKSRYLFNYHRARQFDSKVIIVVEGFFGCVRLCQYGYKCTVALMGSAMSDLQEQYLTRYWEHVVLLMDGDKAGREATEAHYKRLSLRGLKGVYKVHLPDNSQPDTLSPEQIRQAFSTARL
jgi:DNA primase